MNIISSRENNKLKLEDKPSTAIFYSITATQKGLSGVDLGNLLIKRVVETLSKEFVSLTTFATLSPIPRFRKWLEEKISKPNSPSILTKEEQLELSSIFRCHNKDVTNKFLSALNINDKTEEEIWYNDADLQKAFKPILMRLAAYYLLYEKYRGLPMDGVAKFHLRNGAELYRLNWMADMSRKGFQNSLGIMVNYRYCLDDIEENQGYYEREGRIKVKQGVLGWIHNESHINYAKTHAKL